jgi:branched-chain amino acid aminotransferase
VDVKVATWQRQAPNTFPAAAKAGGNYLNSQLIKMEAVADGYAEGIALDVFGYVSEGSGENIFVIRNGEIHTPVSAQSILPGITRGAVMTLAAELGITVKETMITREMLYIADEIFMTGTAAEITPVRSVDKYTVGSGKTGPVTRQLQQKYFDVIHQGQDNRGWLTFLSEGAKNGTNSEIGNKITSNSAS